MSLNPDEDNFRVPVRLVLPLDRATFAWLSVLACGSDQRAAEIVASMLHDIRADDEAVHQMLN